MRVLVTAASRHGSTSEIAETIGRSLAGEGLEVDTLAPERAVALDGYDAFVVGSAVYYGHWLEPAETLVKDNLATLAGKPLWLFSSGPTGSPGNELPQGEAVHVDGLVAASGARGHRLFKGRLQGGGLRFGERAVVRALRAEEGDVRDWDEIDAFAHEIAGELRGAA